MGRQGAIGCFYGIVMPSGFREVHVLPVRLRSAFLMRPTLIRDCLVIVIDPIEGRCIRPEWQKRVNKLRHLVFLLFYIRRQDVQNVFSVSCGFRRESVFRKDVDLRRVTEMPP
jgi:hypothetical protein